MKAVFLGAGVCWAIVLMLGVLFDRTPPAVAQYATGNYAAISYVSNPTITAGGTAQLIVWTLTSPKIRCVQNPSSATEDLFVKFGGTAAATSSHDLPAGVQVCWPWSGTVSVFAVTTGHAFIAFEGQ